MLKRIEILCLNGFFNHLNHLFNAVYEIKSNFAADFEKRNYPNE